MQLIIPSETGLTAVIIFCFARDNHGVKIYPHPHPVASQESLLPDEVPEDMGGMAVD